ncbi:hypothetical protein [Brevibacillus sp. NRS-1366]
MTTLIKWAGKNNWLFACHVAMLLPMRRTIEELEKRIEALENEKKRPKQ